MKDALVKLVTLSRYDTEILALTKNVAEGEIQLKKDESRLALANSQLEDKKKQELSFRSSLGQLETEIKALENRIRQDNYALLSLGNEKEYDAMKLQIQEGRERISTKETQCIEILEEIESVQKTIATYQEKIDAETTRVEGLRQELEGEREKVRDELAPMKKKRDEYAKMIEAKSLATYTRLLNLPDKKPLARLENKTCTGCYSVMPLEVVLQVRQMNSVQICASCGRILYIPEELGQED